MRPRPWESWAERHAQHSDGDCRMSGLARQSDSMLHNEQQLVLLGMIVVGACQPRCCMVLLYGG